MAIITPSRSKAPLSSLIILLISAIVIGIIIGLILWALEVYVNVSLVIVFPILAGALAGTILSRITVATKFRSWMLAFLIGILSGVVIYAASHFAMYYITFRGDIRDFLVESREDASDETVDLIANDFLQDEVGDTGFIGYMKLAAAEGFSITRNFSSSSSSGIDLQGDAVYIFWIVEAAIAAFMASTLGASKTKEPFDEKTGTWYAPQSELPLGVTTRDAQKEFVRSFKDGDFQRAGGMMTVQLDQVPLPRVEVVIQRGNDPTSDIYATIQTRDKRGQVVKGYTGYITQSQFDTFSRAMQGQNSPNHY